MLLSSTQQFEEYLVALNYFDYPCSLDKNDQLRQKVMKSRRRNEHSQRPKTS